MDSSKSLPFPDHQDQKPTNTPVDCKWSSWSNCNAFNNTDCGPGKQTRYKEQPALFGGEECNGRDYGYCEQKSCPNITWSEWSVCSTSCGTGTKRRTHVSQNLTILQSCNEKPCPGKIGFF